VRSIIDHLSESISIDAAVAAADGSAEIAHYAKAAMFMVAACAERVDSAVYRRGLFHALGRG
jgi:hypothetical protein